MQFMYAISSTQCKAARTYLEWQQGDLAKFANVSISTVRSFENGFSPRRSSVILIRKALETAGIEFTQGEGIKRRDNQITIYRGMDSSDQLLNDMKWTIKKHGGDIFCIVKSQEMMLQSFGITGDDDFDSMDLIGDIANFKCVMSEIPANPLGAPAFELRTTLPHVVGPASHYIYGDKYVQVLQDGRSQFLFVVFHIAHAAHDYRSYFHSIWDNALPLRSPITSQERRIRTSIGA